MSMSPEEIEKLRSAFAALSETAQATDKCPAPERIWTAVRGEVPPGDVEQLVDHTLDCPACAESWRLAAELATELRDPSAALESPEHKPRAVDGALRRTEAGSVAVMWSFRRHRGWILAAAAALVLGVVGLRVFRGPDATDTETYRSPEEIETRSLLPEDRFLPRDRCVLKWSAGPDGSRYSIRVATQDLREITSARSLAGPEFAVPASVLFNMPERAKLLWQVEVLLPDGKRLMSRTFVNQLE